MSDDKTHRGPADRSPIALGEDYEVACWTRELGLSEGRLWEVIGRVGNTAEAVRNALEGRR